MKTCRICLEKKELTEFHRDGYKPDGRRTNCKECRREVSRWQKLESRYSLSRDAFYALLGEQGGRCAICLKHMPKGTVVVDHCHDTGIVRGLLCAPCNLGLGHFKDGREPELFDRAKRYILCRNPFNPSTGF